MRWVLLLQEYDFEIKSIAGKKNVEADCCSRLPLNDFGPNDDNEVDVRVYTVTEDFSPHPLLPTMDEVKVAQSKDVTCQQLRDILQLRTPVGLSTTELAQLQLLAKSLTLYRDVLHHVDEQHIDPHSTLRVFVPFELRSRYMAVFHDLPVYAHCGGNKTFERLNAAAYWPNMRIDIKAYVASCQMCQKFKTIRPRRAGYLMPKSVQAPFEVISIDIVGRLPTTKNGDKYILSILDTFSRWPILVPIPDCKANTVANALFDHCISQWNPPKVILTDRGSNFESKLFKHICDKFGIKKKRTTAYHPQTNNVERYHRFLNSCLGTLCSRKASTWDKALPYINYAYRTSPVEGVGISPFEILYGRKPKIPTEILNDNIPSLKMDVIDYANSIRLELKLIHDKVNALNKVDRKSVV